MDYKHQGALRQSDQRFTNNNSITIATTREWLAALQTMLKTIRVRSVCNVSVQVKRERAVHGLFGAHGFSCLVGRTWAPYWGSTCRWQQRHVILPSLLAGQPYEFVPLEWLKRWLDDSTATKEIDNSQFLCSHGKLHPDKVGDAKRVSTVAAQTLYQRYGGGPWLDGRPGLSLSTHHV